MMINEHNSNTKIFSTKVFWRDEVKKSTPILIENQGSPNSFLPLKIVSSYL